MHLLNHKVVGMSDAQQNFDSLYITSHEIGKELKVARSCILMARKRGMLPNAIKVAGAGSFIWERESIKPYLEAWRLALASRRGELV
jgi:hypothetical protein